MRKKKAKEGAVQKPIDMYLLEKIQPQGGIYFGDERFIKTGGGYECCLHIYEFPKDIGDFWMGHTCNITNSIATIDISSDDIIEIKKNINKSMGEQDSRYRNASNYQEKYDAQQRFREMQELHNEINAMGETVKLLDIRIFLSDRTWVGLEEKVKNTMEKLESDGYRPTIFLNETKNEWKSMYRTYKQQQAEPFSVFAQPLTSNAVAGGNPFHFSQLEDRYGSYLGYTPCGGNVIYDGFTKTKTRLYYNSLCVGTMGSGKSTLLKKIFLDRAIRGDFVRTFDITGEFTALTKDLGGKIIKLDGSSGLLNPLEILRAGENERLNFVRHISKVATIYRFLVPSAGQQEVVEFTSLLRELYEKFKLTPDIEDKEILNSERKEIQITGLPSRSYPIFSDLLEHVEKRMEEVAKGAYNEVELTVAQENLLTLERIRKTLLNIVETYGAIFNGYTSFDNILDEQIVTFDISDLKEMEAQIFDAQLFNMLSLCWDNCVTNGTIMKERYEHIIDEEGHREIEFEDVVRFLMIIDESHRTINTQKLQALDTITVYLREARKFFGGILLASQSIRDYVPEGSSDIGINKIKTVFELTQYKFIFHQDSNVLGMMDTIFQNVLTQSQRNRIPKLQQGENILCISSDRNIEFKVHLTPEENQIFSGGV